MMVLPGVNSFVVALQLGRWVEMNFCITLGAGPAGPGGFKESRDGMAFLRSYSMTAMRVFCCVVLQFCFLV